MSMITGLRPWLAAPVFPADEEKTRVAGVLHTVLLAFLAGNAGYIVFIWLLDLSLFRLIVIGPLFLIGLVLLSAMRRGYVQFASVALSVSVWAAATESCLISGGVRAPALSGYVIVVLIAGMLLGWRAALGFAEISLITSLGLLYATNADLLPAPVFEHTTTTTWAVQVVFLLWGTVLLSLARRSTDDALDRVRCELVERRRAEAALKESEERYARLTDAAFEGIGFCENAILFDTNARLAEMLGYTREEMIGMPTVQLVAPESREQVRRRAEAGYQGRYEHLAIRADGSVFPVEVQTRLERYQGRTIRITAVRDISDRVSAEQALVASELRFRVAFHANPAPQLLTRAADGFIIDTNAAYERLVGYAREDLLGKRTIDLPIWVDSNRGQLLSELQAQRRIVARPTQMRARSGDVRDLILSIEPVQLDDQPCWLSVMIDISERVAAERALARSERKFKDLVQSINAVVWEADARTFQFSFVSEQAEKLLGYPAADWLASPTFWADHIYPGDRDAAVNYCVDCTRALEHHEFEYRMIAVDGRVVWLRDLVTVEASEGQPRTLRGVMVDITAQKRAEEALRQLVAGTAATGQDFFDSLVRALAEALGVRYAFVAEVDPTRTRARTIAIWANGAAGEPSEYPLEGSPSQNVLAESVYFYRSGVVARFPLDTLLAEMGVDSYLGMTLRSCDGEALGLLAVLHDGPIDEVVQPVEVLQIFAARTAAELERLRTEQALRKSEEQLRLAIDAARLGTWDWDIPTDTVIWAAWSEAIFGLQPGEFGGTYAAFLDLVHPDDREAVKQAVAECLQGQRVEYMLEHRIVWPAGSIHWIESKGQVFKNDAGRPARLLGTVTDTTERKRAEEEIGLLQGTALAISEATDPQVALNVTLGKVCEATEWAFGQVWMPRGARLENGGAWCGRVPGMEAFKRCSEAMTFPPGVGLPGRVWQSKQVAWVQDVRLDTNFPRAEAARDVGLKAAMAFPVLAGTEVVAIMEFFVVEPRAEDARLVKLVSAVAAQLGTAIQRKRAEEALRESESRFRAIFEGAAIGVALVDTDGRPVTSNPALCEMLGYSAEELHEMQFTQFTHPADAQTDWDLFQELVAGRRDAYQIEKRYYRKDGALIWGRLTISLIQDEIGRPRFAIGMVEDISARKRAEEALLLYTRRLEYVRDIDQIILGSPSLNEIAEASINRVLTLLPGNRAELVLLDWEANEAAIVAQVSDRPTSVPLGFRYSVAEYPPRTALIEGKIVLEDDLSHDQLSTPSLQRLRDEGLRARMLVPLLVQGRLVGAIHLAAERPYTLTADQESLMHEVADHLAIGLQNTRLLAEVQAANTRLHSLSRQLIEAQEAERRRIARELHDEIGQALALIKLNIRAVQPLADTSALAPRLEQSLGIIEATLLRVRALALDLRPAMLDDLGLVAALRWYVDQQARVSGLAAEVQAEMNGDRLPSEIETVCFRIVQEALTNILRHAQAHHVRVRVEQCADAIRLTIGDDGAGFDVGQVLARAKQGASGGLLGMRERAALCGGQLTIESAPTGGTTIHIRIPLERSSADALPASEEVPYVADPRGPGG
jgi:PAS domain S-box-containing protein